MLRLRVSAGKMTLLLLFTITIPLGGGKEYAQTMESRPSLGIPSPLAISPTNEQQSALRARTPDQEKQVLSVLRPRMLQAVQDHRTATGVFRSWRNIIAKTGRTSDLVENNSATDVQVRFVDGHGTETTHTPTIREYHPEATSAAKNATPSAASIQPNIINPHPVFIDGDGDGLTDTRLVNNSFPPTHDMNSGFEAALANDFMPVYYISAGEQQSFANFGDYVPWTVTSLLAPRFGVPNPANSYFHVTPLGLATDQHGNQLYAIRIDYLSLWNADGGLIGGGGACFYSWFGLDSLIQQVSGHELDAERSVLLVAAPAINGSLNDDAMQYSLYSIYTAAHEGTFSIRVHMLISRRQFPQRIISC